MAGFKCSRALKPKAKSWTRRGANSLRDPVVAPKEAWVRCRAKVRLVRNWPLSSILLCRWSGAIGGKRMCRRPA